MFYSKSLVVLSLTVIINFELIFMYGIQKGPNSILCLWRYRLLRAIFEKIYWIVIILLRTVHCFYFLVLHSMHRSHIYPFTLQMVFCSLVWLFKIKLLWTFVNKSLYGHMISFLLVNYLGVKWLKPSLGVFLTFWETAKLFFKVGASFYIPTNSE
jgi:hypothetical protein